MVAAIPTSKPEDGSRRAVSAFHGSWSALPLATAQRSSYVWRQEVRRGRIDYHASCRRYAANGGLDPELAAALLLLDLR
jgi:hypothetical protein